MEGALSKHVERCLMALLLVASFGLRAWHADQPIVENYVGRQIPTAMVAQNLDRGGSILRPELDTGPFPNLFVIEPPVFAFTAVAVRRATNLDLSMAGRLVSALGTALAVWGLHGLVRNREGVMIAWISAIAFAVLPVTVRYGRAFQGDALMLGCVIAALRCWDEFRESGSARWLVPAWLLFAAGLMLKLTSAYMLIPLIAILPRTKPRWAVIGLALSTTLPALAWYVYACYLTMDANGSLAASDNFAIWARVFLSSGLLSAETYRVSARFLLWRAFTPIAVILAVWGLFLAKAADRLWSVWVASAAVALLILAAKLHHEYYWLALAPVVAVGVGRALANLWAWGRVGKVAALLGGLAFVVLATLQTASTWRTPAEWRSLNVAASVVRHHVPEDSCVVAPEALLFTSKRKGCRLEYDRKAAKRAAGEWGGALTEDDPAVLIAFYRDRGARFVADLGNATGDSRRMALHEAIRNRYQIIVDSPDVLLAELREPGELGYAVR